MQLHRAFLHSLAALITLVLLTGCGAAKQGTTNTVNTSTGAPPIIPQGATAECNTIPANAFGVAGVLSSFWNGQTFVDSLARVRLTSVPVDLTTSTTKYISIMRWQVAASTGQKYYNPQPAGIIFVLRSNNQYLNSNSPVLQISKNTINKTIADYQLGLQGITTDTFLSSVLIILTGLTPSEQVFDFNIYDSAVGSLPQGTASALIAPFTADPYAYRISHPNVLLYGLHPNNSMPAGLAESQYVAATNTYCQGFL